MLKAVIGNSVESSPARGLKEPSGAHDQVLGTGKAKVPESSVEHDFHKVVKWQERLLLDGVLRRTKNPENT